MFGYFRHDFASMISSVLQVFIYRKRPMTLDEKLPLFIVLTSFPVAISAYYFQARISETEWTPLLTAGIFAAAGVPLLLFDYLSRRSKATYDWNWFEALVVGLVQATAIIPGWDYLTAILTVSLFFNFKREAAAKYAYYVIAPILFLQAFFGLKEIDFYSSMPVADLSWLSFSVAAIVTFVVSLLVIGGFMKHVQQKGLKQYVFYRWILAISVCVVYWIRTQN